MMPTALGERAGDGGSPGRKSVGDGVGLARSASATSVAGRRAVQVGDGGPHALHRPAQQPG